MPMATDFDAARKGEDELDEDSIGSTPPPGDAETVTQVRPWTAAAELSAVGLAVQAAAGSATAAGVRAAGRFGTGAIRTGPALS